MVLNKYLIFIFLTAVCSCKGQETHNPKTVTKTNQNGPVIVKSFKAVAMAPDFDTTLVSQYFRSIFQDSKGHMWFGSLDEGVVRYDTTSLTYFSSPDGFVSGSVHAINEDKKGNIWLGTHKGLYKYDGKTFIIYDHTKGLTDLNIRRKGIMVNQDGHVWAITQNAVFRYNPDIDLWVDMSLFLFKEFMPIQINTMMEGKDGLIYFVSADKGFFQYDGKTMTRISDKKGLGENYAGGATIDPSGHLWFLIKNGICKYDGKSFLEYTSEDGLGGTEFWGILAETSGIIWVTARGATTRFDPSLPASDPDAIQIFRPEDGFTCCVQSMFQDQSGRMWFGTGQGLFRFDGRKMVKVKKEGPW